jgi:hypothetical protein
MSDEKPNSDYLMPTQIDKTDLVTLTFRLKKKLLVDYSELCKKNETDRSKCLRNFMISELKKEEERIEAEKKKIEEEKIFDVFSDVPQQNAEEAKPKDLNTSVSAE